MRFSALCMYGMLRRLLKGLGLSWERSPAMDIGCCCCGGCGVGGWSVKGVKVEKVDWRRMAAGERGGMYCGPWVGKPVRIVEAGRTDEYMERMSSSS